MESGIFYLYFLHIFLQGYIITPPRRVPSAMYLLCSPIVQNLSLGLYLQIPAHVVIRGDHRTSQLNK